MKKENFILPIVLPLIIVLCLWIYNLPMSDVSGIAAQEYPCYSEDGAWDIREIDFETYYVKLLGDVEYVPNQLLTPEEFALSDDIIVGAVPTGTKYLTSRVRVKVADDRLYSFSRYSPDYGCRIYLNGRLLGNIGVPGTSADTAVPGESILKFAAQPENGMIEIVIQASNFVHWDNSSHIGWVIGNASPGTDWIIENFSTTTLITGFYILLFLFHLLLFFMLPSYRANLWVAFLSLLWAARSGVTGPKIWLSLIPALSWTAAFRMEYLTVPLTLALLAAAYNQIFPGVMQKWFRIAVYAVSGAFSLLFLGADTMFMSRTSIWIATVAGIAAAYVLVRLAMKVRKPKIEQKIIIFGLLLILAALAHDTLYYNNFNFGYGHLMETAVLVFILFQMTAMILATMREVAAAKEAEQKLSAENVLLEEKAKMREEMVHDLSHEVRTPLAVISSYAQIAVRQFLQGAVDEQFIEGLNVIDEEAGRIADLVSHTLAPKEQEITAADIGEIARQLVRLLSPMAQNAGRKITVNIDERLMTACNVGEITQVIWNLLDNALKHGGGGIEVDGNANEEYVYIIITDYGAGIPPEILPRVFERGVSGTDGSGLGLAISSEIVKRYGGQLAIESECGMGTAVTLFLPAYRDDKGDAAYG